MYDAHEAQLAFALQFLRIFMFAVIANNMAMNLYVLFSAHANWNMIKLVINSK